MKEKRRSPEARYAAKSAERRRVDDLRLRQRRGPQAERDAATEALRRIDGTVWFGLREALRGPYDDPKALDTLLRYLAEDPYTFGSGYVKEAALRRLGRWPLTRDDRWRIAQIVLSAVDGPTAREFRCQCKAAAHADRAMLVPALIQRLDSSDDALAWRAYCAAVGMLREEWPGLRRRPEAKVRVGMALMRERLNAL